MALTSLYLCVSCTAMDPDAIVQPSDICNSSDSSSTCEGSAIPQRKRHTYAVVGLFNNAMDALAAMSGNSGNVFKFLYNYGRRGYGRRVYGCVTHRNCGKMYRLCSTEPNDAIITLEETGEHATELSGETRAGITLALKRQADDLLRGGAGKQKAQKLLSESR